MGKENPVLVLALASGYDPQLAVLNELPHSMWGSCHVCPRRKRREGDFAMSGTRALLRELLVICRKVRWVHSRECRAPRKKDE
jgi:hypothetical protein